SDTTYTYTWENVTADGTLSATFVQQSVEPTVVPSEDGVDVPVSWMETYYPDLTYDQMLVKVDEKGANGYTVWQSYVADLNPTVSNSVLTVSTNFVSVGDGNVGFTVTVPAGRKGTVEYIDDLSDLGETGWSTFSVGSGVTATWDGPITTNFVDTSVALNENSQRFYRLKLQLMPTE
ncbi:MAG: hypothetical protein J6Y19_08465, partial [Kiritimatiellae bacterium]|nr:hypothetical protein [Kiritimatiellia bacterium]